MARFYGEIKGRAASKATREGDEDSGIEAHIRGYDVGVKVECFKSRISDIDVCKVYMTGGSRNPKKVMQLGYVESNAKGGKPLSFR